MPAQEYYWTDDDGDHDFENPTGKNWKTAAGVAAGAGVYPGSAAADSIVFPSWAAGAPTVNVDQSANANGIVNVTVEDGYLYGVGTNEAPLVLKAAGSPVWTFKGTTQGESGELWIVATNAALTTVNILNTSALHLVSVVAMTTVNVVGGNVTFDSSLAGNTNAGVTTLNAGIAGNVAQPQVVVDCPVITALNNRGAKISWRSGTIGAYNNYSGTFECAGSQTARTLTASTCYGGVMDFRTGVAGKITLTAALAYKGGQVYWDAGENLQRS